MCMLTIRLVVIVVVEIIVIVTWNYKDLNDHDRKVLCF